MPVKYVTAYSWLLRNVPCLCQDLEGAGCSGLVQFCWCSFMRLRAYLCVDSESVGSAWMLTWEDCEAGELVRAALSL